MASIAGGYIVWENNAGPDARFRVEWRDQISVGDWTLAALTDPGVAEYNGNIGGEAEAGTFDVRVVAVMPDGALSLPSNIIELYL